MSGRLVQFGGVTRKELDAMLRRTVNGDSDVALVRIDEKNEEWALVVSNTGAWKDAENVVVADEADFWVQGDDAGYFSYRGVVQFLDELERDAAGRGVEYRVFPCISDAIRFASDNGLSYGVTV